MNERFIKKLLSNMECGICGQHYHSSNIKVLGHREDMWFLSVFCPNCQSQGLVAAVIKEGKMAEVTTDLTKAERSKFSAAPPLQADDVLDMHNFLKGFKGDFFTLFPKKEGKP